MQHYSYRYYAVLLLFFLQGFSPVFANENPTDIIKAAIDYWRDKSSYSVANMTIHRPYWKRTMTLRMWTQGMKKSLVRVIYPPKDKGNATLTKNDKMWMFSPKTNRIIKIPSSMMNQGWMGSDFSNNDVAKADSLLKHYTHTFKGTETHQGQTVYIVEAVPFDDAPVVWGKEVLKIRADHIILEHAFFDQDNVLVKKMVTRDIKKMGGKRIARVQRMQKAEQPNKWTEIVVTEAQFKLNVPNRRFTLSNLRNPRN
ncbi:MAG: outer membrane lipoprotein-sorting protein [Candidatus Parabeggiatoa sp. nov. 1]|nr:MAG: outer membrane lipoprotein-sorting protein [Gammaproteobacteria bacterium]